jgi:hypothetical protein
MHNLGFALEGAWRVLVAGIVLGAGLPLLFTLGIRSLSWGAGRDAEVDESGVTGHRPNSAGTVLAWALFVIVLAVVVLGITFIVASGFGKALSFEHIYPTIVDK